MQRSTIVHIFLVLVACSQLLIPHECRSSCSGDHYTMTSNGSFFRCLPCAKCHPGLGLFPVCGSVVTQKEKISCRDCPSGKFSDTYDSSPCHTCHECVTHEIMNADCTKVSDRNCSGTCIKGYYFAKRAPYTCQQCSYCCFDGKDEIQQECVNQGLNVTNQHCGQRMDRKCGPEPVTVTNPSSSSSSSSTPSLSSAMDHGQPQSPKQHQHQQENTLAIVLGVFSGVFLVVILVGTLLFIKQRKSQHSISRQRSERYEANSRIEMRFQQTPESPCTDPENQITLEEHPSGTRLPALYDEGFSSLSSTPQGSVQATPCPTDDEHNLPDVNVECKKRRVKRLNSKEDPDNQITLEEHPSGTRLPALYNEGFSSLSSTPQGSVQVTPCPTDDEHDLPDVNVERKKRRVKRLNSKEGGEHRIRSPSGTIKLSTLIKKLPHGGHYQALPPKDPEELYGSNNSSESENVLDSKVEASPGRKGSFQDSLTVVKHPANQEHEEGSRVEFRCQAGKKRNITSYHWLKDGTKIQGQTSSTLVLDAVKPSDFGDYSCEVRWADGQNQRPEKSSAAQLDVSPRKGKRFKFLVEAFRDSPEIQEEVEMKLQKRVPGLGGWKQVAVKYGMPETTRDSLEQSPESGKSVIAFLKGADPDLTVYDFCKTLKEPNIRRTDIVQLLSGHLVSVNPK